MSDVLANESRILVVEGNIGAGKTKLGEQLRLDAIESGRFDSVVVFAEPIKPLLLSAYLKDPARYALLFQHNVAMKVRALYEKARALAAATPRCLVVIDRGMGGNQSFAKVQLSLGHFSQTDYELYREEIGANDGTLDALLADPAFCVVYLRCSPEKAFARMLKRGNADEVAGYRLEYFRTLHDVHEEFLGSARGVTVIDWDDDKLLLDGTLCRTAAQSVLEAATTKQ